VKLRGIILQSDKTSVAGAWIIRPVEMLDLHLAGLGRSPEAPPLAMHAGLHVVLEDDREFVVEQLLGDPREDFVDGLNWTPLETFRKRDHRGWDLTVPATAFRQVDDDVVHEVVEFLNSIEGRPFFGEDCTMLIERAFGKRRLFADSPTPGLRNASGRPCVNVAEARRAARSRRGTPPAGGYSAQVARSQDAMECPERPPLDSSCRGMAADNRSRGRPHLLRAT